MADRQLPGRQSLRRSLLVTPGDNGTLLEKLRESEADVAVIEVEDGVHPARKEVARSVSAAALRNRHWRQKETVVRINLPNSPDGARDISSIVPSQPSAILIPRAESVEDIGLTAELVRRSERDSGLALDSVKIWIQVETTVGIMALARMTLADRRVDGIVLGCGDLSADLRVKRIGLGAFRRTSLDAHELLISRSHVVAVSRAAGIDCFDSGPTHLRDMDLLAERAENSARMGFSGVLVISPRHVAVVNRALSPTPNDDDLGTTIVLEENYP